MRLDIVSSIVYMKKDVSGLYVMQGLFWKLWACMRYNKKSARKSSKRALL